MKAYFLQARKRRLELRDARAPSRNRDNLSREARRDLNRGELIVGHGLTGRRGQRGRRRRGRGQGTGRRVMGRLPGSFAEYALMDEPDAIPVPANLSWEDAAAVPVTFLVVYDMLVQQGNLKAGEWLLVTGVSSGVGVAALQAGKALGAKVIGTSGSREKLEKLKPLGLDLAIQTRNPDFSRQVLEATGGQGVNLIVNNVGGPCSPKRSSASPTRAGTRPSVTSTACWKRRSTSKRCTPSALSCSAFPTN
jgi:NADPH:quinone reductase-like Zn-dependent oxidoreductase